MIAMNVILLEISMMSYYSCACCEQYGSNVGQHSRRKRSLGSQQKGESAGYEPDKQTKAGCGYVVDVMLHDVDAVTSLVCFQAAESE